MNKPLVTVCVPTFNTIATLPRCLEGIRLQHAEDVEILVVDNCSTDGSAELAERSLAGLENARVIRNPSNVGRIENWNRCLDLATGTYLKFIMASDVLWRGAVRCLLDQALARPDAVMIGSQHQFWNGDAAPIPSVESGKTVKRLSSAAVLAIVLDGQNPFWALNGMLIRREPIVAHRLRFISDIPYLADVHFCSRLAPFGEMLFVETRTYWFNTAVKGRFHFAGLDAATYMAESRRLYTDIGALNERLGGGPPDIEQSLLRSFLHCVRSGTYAPSVTTTLRLFAGRPLAVRIRAGAAAAFARRLAVLRGALSGMRARLRNAVQ